MSKPYLHLLLAFIVGCDIWTTTNQAMNGQMISRCLIAVVLAFYYCQEKKFTLDIRDYAMMGFYLTIVAINLLYVSSPSKNMPFIIVSLIIRFALLIFVIVLESTFYIKNRKIFWFVALGWVIVASIGTLELKDVNTEFFPNAILGIEIGMTSALVLYRNAPKKSYEQFVLGIMTLILSLTFSATNRMIYQFFVEVLERIVLVLAFLWITLGVLGGASTKKS